MQSQTMVSGDEQEEIEFLKRMFRRWVYDLAKAKAAQRAARGEHAQPIVMPTANDTAPTKNGDATKASPAHKQKKAQSRSIAANNKTAKNGMPR